MRAHETLDYVAILTDQGKFLCGDECPLQNV
jgi:hypothetical protein